MFKKIESFGDAVPQIFFYLTIMLLSVATLLHILHGNMTLASIPGTGLLVINALLIFIRQQKPR